MDRICPHCRRHVSVPVERSDGVVSCPFCEQSMSTHGLDPRDGSVGRAVAPSARPRPFAFQCMRCGSVLEGRTDHCGRQARCPTCEAVLTVPQVDPRSGLPVNNADPGDDGELPTPVHAYAAAGRKAPRIIRQDDDSLIIECSRCGSHSPITRDNCPACGVPFTMEGASFNVQTASGDLSGAAVVLGVIALITASCPAVGLLPGGIAVVLGLHARRRQKHHRFGMAETGILLGIVAGAVSLIMLFTVL